MRRVLEAAAGKFGWTPAAAPSGRGRAMLDKGRIVFQGFLNIDLYPGCCGSVRQDPAVRYFS